MIVTLSRETLEHALKIAARIAGKGLKSAMESMVLLDAKAGALAVSATDLCSQFTTSLTADVQRGGSVAIAGRQVAEVVAALRGELVRIETQGHFLTVRAGSMSARLPTGPAEHFPALAKVASLPTAPVDETALLTGLRAVDYAMGADQARPFMMGVAIEPDPACGTIAVATDGHRMVCAPLPEVRGLDSPCFVPAVGVSAIQHVLASGKDHVAGLCDGWLVAASSEGHVAVRLGDQKFPPWRRMLTPKSSVAVLPRQDLLASVESAAVVLGARAGLDLALTEQGLLLRGVGDLGGEFQDLIEGAGHEHAKVRVSVAYLRETLAAMPGEAVALSWEGELDPVSFRAAESAHSLALIMPMRS